MAPSPNLDSNKNGTECVSFKPLHSHNSDSKSCGSRYSSNHPGSLTPTSAKDRFSERVSNGISVLIKRHGFSRKRASDLILKEISQGVADPTEDEIFSVMRDLRVGMDEAVKALTVAKALRRIENQRGLSSSDAIEYISSCLTVMKILGKVESQQAEAHLNHDSKVLLKDQQPGNWATAHKSSSHKSTLKNNLLSNSKTKLTRQTLSAASLRKRSSMDSKHDANSTCKKAVDDPCNVKVVKQAISDLEQSHHHSDSSLSRNKRAADSSIDSVGNEQPPSSRPRLNSMGVP